MRRIAMIRYARFTKKLTIILLLISVFMTAYAFAAAPPPTVTILSPRPGTATAATIVSLTSATASPANAFKVQIQVWNDVALSPDITNVAVGYCPSASDPNNLANFTWANAALSAGYSCGTNCGIYEATVSGLPAGSYYLSARAVSTADGTGYSGDNRTGNDAKFTYITVRLANAANKGTGMLLARDSSSELCLDCHNIVSHSSQTTSASYGNWQIACRECHTPHSTRNIFLIKETIMTPKSGNKTVAFYNTTGDAANSYVDSAAGAATTGVCQVCHTQTVKPGTTTARWRNTGNSDNHYTQAAGTQRCTGCHPHTEGFKGSCTMCHGNPPVDNASLIGSTATFGATGRAAQTPPGAGVHATHVTTKGYVCDTCHTGGGASGNHNKITSPALVQIGFNLFSGAYTSGAYQAPDFTNANYDLAAGNAGTTLTVAGTSRNCSNIYCHSKGQSSSTFTGGNAPNLGAVWEGSLNATCSGCHGNDASATYQISSGSHTKHAITNGYGCTKCHNATASDNRTISTQANHVNNLVNVAFDGTAAVSGTYNGTASPMTKAPGSAYGACTNITCHNDGRSVWNGTTGVGNTNNWGTAGGCNNCHGNTTYTDYRLAAPLYASTSTVPPGKPNAHVKHVDVRTTPSNEPQCKHCHSTVTATNTAIDGTTPANHANSAYNVTAGSTYYNGDNVGGGYTTAVTATYAYNANPTTSTCSNVSCHPTGIAGTKAASSTKWDTTYSCTDCHNINMNNTTGYHHVMDSTAMSNRTYPTAAPTSSATDANRKCTMCHVDHDIFSPMLNTNSSGRSYNLRTAIGTTPTTTTGYTNSDYATGGGICISCHANELTKNTTNQKNETGSTKTVQVTDANFSASAHQYAITSTMANGSTIFNANCSKCHNSKNGETTSFQSSTNKFGAHDNPLRRLFASLGITSPTDPEEEDFCYRCHSKTGDTNPGGGPAKGTANKDYYGIANMSNAAEDIFTVFGKTYKHNVAGYSGLHKPSSTDETLAYISANKHIECGDCHNPHAASAGNHTPGSATLANVLKGVWGAAPNYPANTNWPATGTPPRSNFTYAVQSAATSEYQICFKCHSYANTNVLSWGASPPTGAAAWTDVGLEFNPSNQSYHPVVAALPATDPSTTYGSKRLDGGLVGWTSGSIMTCSDCHATDSTSSKGPHGSATKWMLAGTNKAWPYTTAANNGGSTGTLRRIEDKETNLGTANGLFCRNCHAVDTANNDPHKEHTSRGIYCVNCHIRVPHGGKVSRLIAATGSTTYPGNLPTRYTPDGQGGRGGNTVNVIRFVRASAWNNYSKSNCYVTGSASSSCMTHGSIAGENW